MYAVLAKRWLRSDAIWTQPFVYKTFVKHIALFFDTWALMKSQYWSREKIEKLQDEQLTRLFKHAEAVPYWHELFQARGVDLSAPVRETLAKLPVSGKRELVQHTHAHITDADSVPYSHKDHTSGSTGRPFHFNQDWRGELRSCAVTERTFRTMTGGVRYPIVYMRTRERHGFTFYKHVWFYLRGFNSVQYREDDFRKLGESLPGGFILYGYTSWVMELARRMEEWNMMLPIRAVMVAGEHCSEADREYMARIMGAPVTTMYASREVGFLGYECEEGAMHVNEEWALLEIVDREGNVLPEGEEGRILVTTFDNRVMPFIRYELGDIGSLSSAPCPCGRTLKTIQFKGRSIELIELEDDRVVSLLDVAYVLGKDRKAVLQYQIIQTAPLSFVIKVIPGITFTKDRQFYLEMLLVRLLHPKAQITWVQTDAIPEATSGKAVYFIKDFEYRA